MSLPWVISTIKEPTKLKTTKCLKYEQEVPMLLSNPQLLINTTDSINSSNSYVLQGTKLVKRKRKNKSRCSVRLSDCEAALNIYSLTKGKIKPAKGGKHYKSHSKSQDCPTNTSSKTHCTIKSLISSYSSSKNCTPKTNKLTHFKTNSLTGKTPNSKKCTNFKAAAIIRNKQQSCPPLIQKSNSLVVNEVKVRKIYYSEPQSYMLAGVPCAPPVSPINDVMIAFEIVPSLADIKSQQTVKAKLKNIGTARQKENEKLKALFNKKEKRREKEEQEMLKEQRRAEIYALNEVMTQLERTKFLKFIKEKCNGTTTISLNA